jgi:DUF1680 family protein
VRLGPVVYCLESTDVPAGSNIFDYTIDASSRFNIMQDTIHGNTVVFLTGEGLQSDHKSWKGTLYRNIEENPLRKVSVKLIPYYAWGNRGKSDMTVWMPVFRSKIQDSRCKIKD